MKVAELATFLRLANNTAIQFMDSIIKRENARKLLFCAMENSILTFMEIRIRPSTGERLRILKVQERITKLHRVAPDEN